MNLSHHPDIQYNKSHPRHQPEVWDFCITPPHTHQASVLPHPILPRFPVGRSAQPSPRRTPSPRYRAGSGGEGASPSQFVVVGKIPIYPIVEARDQGRDLVLGAPFLYPLPLTPSPSACLGKGSPPQYPANAERCSPFAAVQLVNSDWK